MPNETKSKPAEPGNRDAVLIIVVMMILTALFLVALKLTIDEVVWLRDNAGERFVWQIGIGGTSTALVIYTAWFKSMEWLSLYRRRVVLREEMRRHWAEE